MRAYKFLASGAISPFARFAWPMPDGAAGAWVVADGPLMVGKRGAHVCRVANLAHWLHDELWVVDIDGEQVDAPDCLVVARARLVHHVEAWRAGGASRFAEACITHARDLTRDEMADLLDDAAEMLSAGYSSVAAYTAALAVARLDGLNPVPAYDTERAWQSAWIAHEIIPADFL